MVIKTLTAAFSRAPLFKLCLLHYILISSHIQTGSRLISTFIYTPCACVYERNVLSILLNIHYVGCVKRIWYLSPMRAAKVQASLRIRAVSPEPSLLAHTSNESRGTFRQKARSLAPLNGLACAVEICHDGMLEDTNSLDGAHVLFFVLT